MKDSRRFDLQRMPLRRKLILPFLLILIAVGSIATTATILFVSDLLGRSVEDRLQSLQNVAYREIKKQELLLLNYASILEYLQALQGGAGHLPQADILQDQLYASLHESRITVAFYPPTVQRQIPYESLSALLDQAQRSGEPRFRFTTDFGATPSLAVAVASRLNSGFRDTIVLQVPIGRSFLHSLADGFQANISLLSLSGQPLVSSSDSPPPLPLTEEELAQVISGEPLVRTVAGVVPHKYHYHAIPLGTTDLVLSVADAPMTEIGGTIDTLVSRAVLIFLVAFVLGALLYYRLVRQVTAPAEELLYATQAISRGDLDYRVEQIADNDLGRLASSFNQMMARLELIHDENLAQEKALTRAQEELRYKEVVEEKNRLIEKANEELRAHLAETSALFQMTQAMTATLDINLLFDRMVEVMGGVLHCQGMALLLYHPGGEELELRRAAGMEEKTLVGCGLRLDGGFIGRAAQMQEVVYIADLAADQPSYGYRGGSFPGGSLICAPMVVKKRLVGVLLLLKEQAQGFSETELKMSQVMANQTAIAVENARLYESTRQLSNMDELTRLANRRYFQEILRREVAQAHRYPSDFSLIMVDVDHFKRYNDTHGHLCGDTALRMVADLLLQNTRGIDLVSRFGGDEFVVLLPKTDRGGALAAAEKLRQCVAETAFPGARRSQPGGSLTISLGVAAFPDDARDIFELLDRADRSLYRAKQDGRNRATAWPTSAPAVGAPPA
ncbi:MAG: diguanylate cyclase [Desulfuromonadales bacterium]|nr:diguanylate cyclase [Desulfuromonadales bacterium]